MKRYVKSAISDNDTVNLLAKTESGKWVVVFRDIPRHQAEAIWDAGFATGDNRFSVEDETSRSVMRGNYKTLGYSDEEIEARLSHKEM